MALDECCSLVVPGTVNYDEDVFFVWYNFFCKSTKITTHCEFENFECQRVVTLL
jgi:hypothetical protein